MAPALWCISAAPLHLSVRVRRRWAHKHVRCILILIHYGGVFRRGTCRHMQKKTKKPNPTHLHVWFRLILSFMLVPSALPRLLTAWGRAGVSCSSCTCRGLPVSTNNSLPAATWPTSKVPPLLCCGAISKVRQNEMGDKWGGAWRRRADKLQRCFIYCPERQNHWVFLPKLIRLEFVSIICKVKALLGRLQDHLLVQSLPILSSRSGFSFSASQLQAGSFTTRICEAEMSKYIEFKFRQ